MSPAWVGFAALVLAYGGALGALIAAVIGWWRVARFLIGTALSGLVGMIVVGWGMLR